MSESECMMNYDVGLGCLFVCLFAACEFKAGGAGVMHAMACRFDRSVALVALHARSSSGLRRWLLAIEGEGESLDWTTRAVLKKRTICMHLWVQMLCVREVDPCC